MDRGNRKEQLEKMADALIPWYKESGRSLPWRLDPTPYHVWVSEIMLQQTRIEAVIPYYHRFLAEIPDIKSLAEASPDRLQKLWEGLGYYSRVRNLQTAARQIMEKYGGEFPRQYADIQALTGIGYYTAGAIGSICFGLPTPAVDGNVLRVIARLTRDVRPIDDEKVRKEVRSELAAIYPGRDAGALTQAIMELGETVCLPHGVPACSVCPCRSFCPVREGEWEDYPVRSEKKARRKEQMTVFLLNCDGYTAIRKRPEQGLLSGLWELPNCSGNLSADAARRQAAEWGCEPAEPEDTGILRHIFTHIEWEMRCFTISCARRPEIFVWADGKELEQNIPLPTAFRKVLSQSRS